MRELLIKEDGKETGMFRVIDANQPIARKCLNIKNVMNQKILERKHFYSIEVMPVVSAEDLNYNDFIIQPMFTAITWLSNSNITSTVAADVPAIKFASMIKNSNAVLSHITCYKLTQEKLTDILSNDVQNVFAIRGDRQSVDQPMKYAVDLVRELRRSYSDLTIGVAGYPQTHPDASSPEEDLRHLKEKVDAGADFIITQICFSFDDLSNFIKLCRQNGITCPIIPGIFIPTSYEVMIRLCEICRVTIPINVLKQYKTVKDDTDKFVEIAMANTFQFIDKIFKWDFEDLFGIHFFTINKFKCIREIITRYESILSID